MSHEEIKISCCGSDNFCQDFSCSIEETDNGVSISLTSDDPEKVQKLKSKLKCCDESRHSNSCC